MVLFSLMVYAQLLNGEFIADDLGQIVANRYINSIYNIPSLFKGGTFDLGYGDYLQGMYYRPMMMIFYTLISVVFGVDARFYHLIQILLHVINSFLVYIFFHRLMRSNITAILFSLIFLLHPMNAETVSYIANLQDILMFLFGFMMLLLISDSSKNVYKPVYIFLLFLAALLSKESAVIFAPIVYLFINLFDRGSKTSNKIMYAALMSAIGIYIYLRCGLAKICLISSNAPIGKLAIGERLLHVPYVVGYYLKTFFYPNELAFLQQWTIRRFAYSEVLLLTIFLISVLGFVIIFPLIIYLKRKSFKKEVLHRWFQGKYPAGRVYVFFLMWFLTGLSMHIHLIPLDFTVADRWFYVTMAGLLGMFGSILYLTSIRQNRLVLIGAVLVVLLAARTYVRVQDWSDPMRLYSHDISVSPDSGPLQNNYAAELLNRGKITEAKKHFETAAKLQPENPIYWSNLGIVAEKEGDPQGAINYYHKSTVAGKWKYAFERYVALLENQGKSKEARVFLTEKGLKYFPDSEFFITAAKRLKED